MSELWTFISENADALGVVFAFATLIGGIIGFFIRTILGCFSKSSKQKKEKTTELQKIIEDLKNKTHSLESELAQYHDVVKGEDGDYLLQTKTSMKICPICWYNSNKTIPVFDDGFGKYKCSVCHSEGIYDLSKHNAEQARQDQLDNAIFGINYNFKDYYQ